MTIICGLESGRNGDYNRRERRAPTAFISALTGIYAGSTIINYLNGVHAWHTIHGLPWSLNSDETDALLKAAKVLAPPSSKRPPHEPYTVDTIILLHTQLSLSNPLHAAVFACLTTTFFATAHTGEFTVPNLKAFDPTIHITRANVSGEDVNWACQNGLADPQAALENHFAINETPQTAHLFAYKHKNHLVPLTYHKFLKTLETTAKHAGITPLKGHSICIGSTLEYLL
ncbi:hypothetical protein EV363DRAFT_1445944 [Boletus edulis]|nr:hypothetical protein EV363DRAFT_1445944 [Boletus edulis]